MPAKTANASQSDLPLQIVLTAASQLSEFQRQELIKHLAEKTAPQAGTVLVFLRRLSPEKQRRMLDLMERNNEGQLTPAEQKELSRLGRKRIRSCFPIQKRWPVPPTRNYLMIEDELSKAGLNQ